MSVNVFQSFVGMCGALMFGVGLVGAGLAAVLVDKTKKFEEVAKAGMALSVVMLIAFLVVCIMLGRGKGRSQSFRGFCTIR